MTSRRLLLEMGCLCQPLLHSWPHSLPRTQAQRGQRTGPRSHSSLDQSCGRPAPTHPAWPSLPKSPGRAAPAPTWPKAQAGIRPPPSPPSPSPRAAPSQARRSAPLCRCLARPQPFAPAPPPQEFNPLPAEGRATAPHSWPAGTREKGPGRPGEGEDPSNSSTRSRRAVRSGGQSGQVGG